MSEQNSTFIVQDSCLIKDETGKCPDHSSILLDSIKAEIITYQNYDENNQSYYIEENIINKSNNITLDSSNIEEINVLDINIEKGDSKTDIQNAILIVDDNHVKEEMYIKEELTYLNGDDDNTENVIVNYNKSNNVTINTLNIFKKIKTEIDCTNTSLQNSILVIDDRYSVKDEIDSIPHNTKSSLLSPINEENIFIKIEQLSPEGCDIFTENILEIKTESDYKRNNIETTRCVLKCEHKDVNKHSIKKLKSITNSDKEKDKRVICKQSFIHNGDLKNLICTKNCKKNCICDICTHTYKKLYKCKICQKFYSQQKILKCHMLTHTGESPYKCGICHKSFAQKSNLNTHMLTHTGDKPYKCKICEKSFSLKQPLANHMLTHTGEKPFKCKICKKSFSVKHNLNNHILIHTGKKPYNCKICQKLFTQKSNLNTHMLTHTDVKPHKCNICEKSYTQKLNLNNHMLTHTGVKPYKCNICEKSYTQKCNLNNHMLAHTGVKPYKCNICEKSYTQKRNLNHHILIHTGHG